MPYAGNTHIVVKTEVPSSGLPVEGLHQRGGAHREPTGSVLEACWENKPGVTITRSIGNIYGVRPTPGGGGSPPEQQIDEDSWP